MTVDQKIQVWNAVGTWVAGIATFGAVFVSLYLARAAGRVKISATVGLRQIVGRGVPTEDLLQIAVTNLGERPVTVSNIGWVIGKRSKRRYALQLFGDRMSADVPYTLTHGQRATFNVLFSSRPDWMQDFMTNYVKSAERTVLRTLTAEIYTSVGQTVRVKPEQLFLEKLAQVQAALPPT